MYLFADANKYSGRELSSGDRDRSHRLDEKGPGQAYNTPDQAKGDLDRHSRTRPYSLIALLISVTGAGADLPLELMG